jgi:hypothetical protein
MTKNILIIQMVALCTALFGCATVRQPDLTGKWINADRKWGLEFRAGQVLEWEGDNIQTRSSFVLTSANDTLTLSVNQGEDDVVTFTVELLDDDSIRLSHDELGERIELRRQRDPTNN